MKYFIELAKRYKQRKWKLSPYERSLRIKIFLQYPKEAVETL